MRNLCKISPFIFLHQLLISNTHTFFFNYLIIYLLFLLVTYLFISFGPLSLLVSPHCATDRLQSWKNRINMGQVSSPCCLVSWSRSQMYDQHTSLERHSFWRVSGFVFPSFFSLSLIIKNLTFFASSLYFQTAIF